MVRRDVSRSGVRNGRRLMRDRSGRLLGSTRIVLSAIQVRAVERAWRKGESVESVADMAGVSINTLYAILARQLTHIRRRGRGRFVRRETTPPTELEIVQMTTSLRQSRGE